MLVLRWCRCRVVAGVCDLSRMINVQILLALGAVHAGVLAYFVAAPKGDGDPRCAGKENEHECEGKYVQRTRLLACGGVTA